MSTPEQFIPGAIVTSRIGKYEVIEAPFKHAGEFIVSVRACEERTIALFGSDCRLMPISALVIVEVLSCPNA